MEVALAPMAVLNAMSYAEHFGNKSRAGSFRLTKEPQMEEQEEEVFESDLSEIINSSSKGGRTLSRNSFCIIDQ